MNFLLVLRCMQDTSYNKQPQASADGKTGRAHVEGTAEAVLGAQHKGADEAIHNGHDDARQNGRHNP